MVKLECRDVSFSYGERRILDGVSFDLKKGEFLSVLGPNGVGKSTLFRCILGRLTDYTGQILSEGEDVRTLSRKEAARRIAYIPQIHQPTFEYSVIDTVLMGTTRQLASPFAQPRKEQLDAAMAALVWAWMNDLDLKETVQAGLAAGSIAMESSETINPAMSATALKLRMSE